MNLAKAIAIASAAHITQTTSDGKPYILHPLKVMYILIEQGIKDEHTLILAVLHDLLEDFKHTKYTEDMLRADGFSEAIIEDLLILKRDKKEDYEKSYIPRVASKYRTAVVKRADLIHNSDIFRLLGITQEDHDRIAKYHRSFVFIQERIAEYESCIMRGY